MDLPEADRPADARKWFRAFFVGFVRGRGKDRKPENKKYAAFKFQNFSMSSKKEKLPAFSAGKRNGRKALESALSDAFHFFALADIAFETGKERCYADSSIRDAIFFTGGINMFCFGNYCSNGNCADLWQLLCSYFGRCCGGC